MVVVAGWKFGPTRIEMEEFFWLEVGWEVVTWGGGRARVSYASSVEKEKLKKEEHNIREEETKKKRKEKKFIFITKGQNCPS